MSADAFEVVHPYIDAHALLNMVRQRTLKSTESAVAAELGVSPQYLNDYLRGRREAGGKLLAALGFRKIALFQQIDRKPS